MGWFSLAMQYLCWAYVFKKCRQRHYFRQIGFKKLLTTALHSFIKPGLYALRHAYTGVYEDETQICITVKCLPKLPINTDGFHKFIDHFVL